MADEAAYGAVLDRPAGELSTGRPIDAPSIVADAAHERIPRPPVGSPLPRCPEIDCVRHILSPAEIALAELRSAEVGVGADRVLVTQGLLDEEAYLRVLTRQLRIVFEPLDDQPRDACPLNGERLLQAAELGMLPLSTPAGIKIVVAPRSSTVRNLFRVLGQRSDVTHRMHITTNARLNRFIVTRGGADVAYRAAESLRAEKPELSAGTGRNGTIATATGVAVIAMLALLENGVAAIAVELILGAIFLAWTALRMLGIFYAEPVRAKPEPITEKQLPLYSVVVALYRESAAVGDLVEALSRLNYPLEKLDIKLVLEPDDHETRATVDAMNLTAPFEIIIAPAAHPKTKPKALNAALPFCRGEFLAIYDAEDRPEPDQLRLALEAFVAGDERLACVQARLTIDNTSDSWLTRLFTAEYAGLFDVFLPGLAAWRLPLPLGGSSNHFRTSVLRKTGAWDPYNVTEDADLGMRISRLGYRTAVIRSTTYEEAPARIKPWLKQRTRWIKGWVQTWLVHMRSPRRLRRELGWVGFSVFQLLVGGTVLAALVHSLFVAQLLWEFAGAAAGSDSAALRSFGFHVTALLVGYMAFILLGLVGLSRRRLLGCAWALMLVPVYWILLSIAAWRALFQLVRDPYRWEKTEHGLARSSRLAQQITPDCAEAAKLTHM
jgi:glycosyltransferase XagB